MWLNTRPSTFSAAATWYSVACGSFRTSVTACCAASKFPNPHNAYPSAAKAFSRSPSFGTEANAETAS